jgi:hypothetical protein
MPSRKTFSMLGRFFHSIKDSALTASFLFRSNMTAIMGCLVYPIDNRGLPRGYTLVYPIDNRSLPRGYTGVYPIDNWVYPIDNRSLPWGYTLAYPINNRGLLRGYTLAYPIDNRGLPRGIPWLTL